MANLLRLHACGSKQPEVLVVFPRRNHVNNKACAKRGSLLWHSGLAYNAPYPLVPIVTNVTIWRTLNIRLYIGLGENKYKLSRREMFAEMCLACARKESEPAPAVLSVGWLLLPRCAGILTSG